VRLPRHEAEIVRRGGGRHDRKLAGRTAVCDNQQLRMGRKLDSATSRTSAALSGYAYVYRYAWRFS
jgi:hypothetical protein